MTRPELLESPAAQQPLEAAPPVEAAPQSNIYRIAWQRKSLLILGLVVGIGVGFAIYANKDPVYQSTAQVSVMRRGITPLQTQDLRANVMEDYIAYHAALIRSHPIMRNVINDPDIRKLETFSGKTPADMLTILALGLNITRFSPDPNSRSPILQLTFKGPNQNDCQSILDGIIKHYKAYLKETYQTQGSDLLAKVKEYERIVNEQLANVNKQHSKFREQNPPIVSNKDGRNPKIAELEYLLAEKIKLNHEITDIKSRLAIIEQGAKQGAGRSLLYIFPQSNLVKPGQEGAVSPIANTSERLLTLNMAGRELAAQVGPNHPDRKRIDLQIDSLEKYINEQTKELTNIEAQSGDASLARESPLVAARNAFQFELKRLDLQLKAITEQIAVIWEEAKIISNIELQDKDFENRKKNYDELRTAVLKQINTTQLTKDDEVYIAETMNPPSLAQKVEPKALVILTLSTVIGLLGGFFLAFLADMTDKSFRSPDEIRRRLNIPVIGHVPMLLSEEEAAKLEGAINGPDPTMVTYYRPKSRKAEVFRGIRTALYFSTRGEGHKVIQITSPNMGDGKTTLASNLAISIAQSGKQTILIDADFRRPRLHKLFAVASEKGFASVLTGQCDLRDATQPTMVPGLSIIPCGPIPPNPAELLTSPRFKELIDELREQYDYVILDTPPLLVVTDPCAVAPRVDGVLMTMRVIKNGRPVAERARDILVSLGAKPLGIIVNGVSFTGPSGYGYGSSYGYGYGYGQYDYANAYQYKYDYSDRYYAGYGDEGYYQDREPTEVTPEMPHSSAPANRLPADAPESAKQ